VSHLLRILRQNVHFNVYWVSFVQRAKIGGLPGVRDEGDLHAPAIDRSDSQADAFHRDGSLRHHITRELRRNVDDKAPAQFCTFSWALVTMDNTSQVVEGFFLILPKASNMQVYQGAGFMSQLSSPIILCRGSKAKK